MKMKFMAGFLFVLAFPILADNNSQNSLVTIKEIEQIMNNLTEQSAESYKNNMHLSFLSDNSRFF